MIFAYVPVEEWIIHLDINWFFDCSGEFLVLPLHYTEVFKSCGVACDVMMVTILI